MDAEGMLGLAFKVALALVVLKLAFDALIWVGGYIAYLSAKR